MEAISPWGYGLRIGLATSLALYVAFWLQLASAVSAALTVAILAQPRRDQALARALYRFAYTAVGALLPSSLSPNMRCRALTTLSTSTEEKQQFDAAFKMTRAAVADALAQRAQADVNLHRTEVRSSVNGYVSNLLLRPGDYAMAGLINVSIINSNSFWVDGYFDEPKLAWVQVGDSATIQLMGYAVPLRGVVESVTSGISLAQAASSTQGLPNIDPVYSWVRLAQRILIRVRITNVPPGVVLAASLTCTVSVIEPLGLDHDWLTRLQRRLLGASHAP